MKNITTIVLACFLFAYANAQKERAVTANLTGFVFQSPIFIEFETMVSNGLSLGYRANYINYSLSNTVPYTDDFFGDTGTFSYSTEGSGVGIGFYARHYFEKTGYINGFYLGIGVDVLLGNFETTDETLTDNSLSGGGSEGIGFFGGSIPIGYRFQAGSILFDLSLAFRYSEHINSLEKEVFEKTNDFNIPGVYFLPALGIGIKF